MQPAVLRGDEGQEASPSLWLRAGSLFLLLLALALLVLAIVFREDSQSNRLLLFLFLALCCAAVLQIYYLAGERRRHRRTARAFYATDREFRYIYEHALDGIVILDDDGICLDANPAAFALLRLPRAALVGNSFARFYTDLEEFQRGWKAFLERNYQRGEAELSRSDGTKFSVSYTAAANYLPGRHVVILCDTTEKRQAESSLLASEERFRQMAANIQEIFWMMRADTKEVLYVNQAYETITGRDVKTLYENPLSYPELIHPEDRAPVLLKLDEATRSGSFDREFRIVRPDGCVRWVWVKAFPVRNPDYSVRSLVGTVQDITKRKQAEAETAGHLAAAEAARAEAEALRRATLALTENLSMDVVLDTLLASLFELVPYDSASVILTEGDSKLMVAREAPSAIKNKTIAVLDARDNALLQRVLLTQKSVLINDTRQEADWNDIKHLSALRTWMCVPLVASDHVLGLLAVGHAEVKAFTPEHLRRTKSLAIGAAVAIQNARLYERAEFCAAALELRLREAHETEDPLEPSKHRFWRASG